MGKLKNIIEEQIEIVRRNGVPVIVNKQGTIEILNYSFNYLDDDFINTEENYIDMLEYYKENNINYEEILKLEKDEYAKITEGVVETFKKFDEDINTRQAIWVSPWCISMIHFIVRNNILHCFVKLRSSDVVKLLISDMRLILELVRKLQEKLNIKNVFVNVNIDSAHIIVIEDITKI
jgi:hypothetical protein